MESKTYQLYLSDKFSSSLNRLLKSHYKKDKKARAKFIELIEEFKQEVVKEPISNLISNHFDFPIGSEIANCCLRKKRWNRLPGLSGSSRFGRLLYLVDETQKAVVFLWIYTHEEYGEPKSQPPNKEIKQVIKDSYQK